MSDRTNWGEGPWDKEEDHYVWVDAATDLDCMINRGPSGSLCGYVGVGPDHPMHGVMYDDIDVDVHGGLTYSRSCQEGGEICHVPAEGREHDIWWLGFDCAHFMDLSPGTEASLREMNKRMAAEGRKPLNLDAKEGMFPKKYRDVEYVTNEVKDLAAQLKLMT